MVYELVAFNTDCRYQQDIRYCAYTSSKTKADKFDQIPKIQFTDSGHGIVFNSREHKGHRKPCINNLSDYVNKYLTPAPMGYIRERSRTNGNTFLSYLSLGR